MNRFLIAGFLGLCLATPRFVSPHGGEDHGGAGLSTGGGTAAWDQPLFVPVETQILARIETEVVESGSEPVMLRVLGRTQIRPDREAIMTSVAEGILVSADGPPPSVGEFVTKGQQLAIVEETVPATDLVVIATERARVAGELRQAEAELSLAERESERVRGLEGVVTDKDLAAAGNAVEVAKARRDGLKEQLAQLGNATVPGVNSPRRRILSAPIDGVIAQTHVTLGENVGPDKPLFHILDLTELYVEADVFENDVAAVMDATTARFTAEAFPGESFPARIASRGTTIDPQTRALHVLFSVGNPGTRLLAGMFGHVYIETGASVQGFALPPAAVVDAENHQVVFVKQSGEVFLPVPVRVLTRGSDRLIVEPVDEKLLKEGDRVAVQGTYQIRMSKPAAAKAP
ncbi:efflux RND transporter periplasmic adaptor subunit [Candidatus Poribacteria bacterium]|nr:efflux RND transporter periplasmic adaptor subunit [Candidatus Poribacteria bacterium]